MVWPRLIFAKLKKKVEKNHGSLEMLQNRARGGGGRFLKQA